MLQLLKYVVKYCEKVYKRSGKNLFWSVKNSGEILDKLKARDFDATSLSTYDFSSLYTTLPHSLIKDKLIVVDFLFIVTPIVGVCNCSMFCCMLLFVHSSIAVILMGKRELVALLNFSSWCLVMVERLFLTVPWGCLRFVIVVFPDHTHLLFLLVLLK